VVDSRDDKLRYTTDRKTSHEENAAATNLRDDTAVDHDYDDTDGGQDARVHEGATNIRHLA